MTAAQKDRDLQTRLERRGMLATLSEAHTLRLAQCALHRWSELECGDGNDYASWAIERDEKDGKPYMVTYPHTGDSYRRPIADREKGALSRVAELCASKGWHFYYQTDPRGCALYIDREPIRDNAYTNAVPVY